MDYRRWLFRALVVGLFICGASGVITSCVQCSTDGTPSCAAGNIPSYECDIDNEPCYLMIKNGHIKRGCLNYLDELDKSRCANATDSTCLTCNSNGCNNGPWLKCHTCDPSNPKCTMAQQNGAKLCAIYDSNDTCYSKLEGDNVTRGCSSDLQLPAYNKDYELCTGSGCNKLSIEELKNFTMCLQCDSIDCTNTTLTKCPNRSNVCFSRVEAGILQRGCLMELSVAEQTLCNYTLDRTCQTCTGNSCNSHQWLQCHQCNSNTDAACNQSQNALSSLCENFKTLDRCYERLDNSTISRGCESDLGIDVDACDDNRHCRTCTTAGCNREDASTLETTDRCLQCNSVWTLDEGCLTGESDSQPCAKPSAGKCYSKIDTNGTLSRGCWGDLTEEEVKNCTGYTCLVCEGESCNDDKFPTDRLSCHRCESEPDGHCSDLQSGESTEAYCQTYQPGDRCYTRIKHGLIQRGCQSDLATAACEGLKANECRVCSGENCNNVSEKDLTNTAGVSSVSTLLFTLVTLIAVFC
ncbi:uncharacterized protein LOC131437566 [Malaya genurostris]|uniref:uncharacterized protein LOC131437566 n=1 Tax=Malaya genurostris TaxID=325434 RepID=UPI0026F3AD4A|nr:uncharacterized protein LOC131437566 [Malaya genurostris]